MKKNFFYLFSLVTVVALTIIGGFHYYSAQQEARYATTAVPYLKQVVPELSKWEPEIAQKYMSHDFMQKISPADFALIIKALSKVGQLEQLEEPQFEEIYSGDTPMGEKQTIISYTVKAKYTTGVAIITMSLLDRAGTFEVYRFNVQSEALAR